MFKKTNCFSFFFFFHACGCVEEYLELVFRPNKKRMTSTLTGRVCKGCEMASSLFQTFGSVVESGSIEWSQRPTRMKKICKSKLPGGRKMRLATSRLFLV